MWCIYVCVCAPAEKGEGCGRAEAAAETAAERQGEAEGTHTARQHGTRYTAQRGTARRSTRTRLFRIPSAAPSEERAWHGGMHTQRAGGTQGAQDGRARNRRPSAPRAAPQRARPPAWDGAPWLLTSRQTLLCTHGSQRTPEGGAHAPAPLRAPRPVHRPAPPGPPGSPARGGPDPHTVTTAGGLSDEEERSATYAWLQRTAWECVSGDQRGSGPERTGRTERGRAMHAPEDGRGARAGPEACTRRCRKCTQRGGKCAQVVAERCLSASGAVRGVSGALPGRPLAAPKNPKKRGAGGPQPPHVPRGLPRTI